MKTRKQRQQDAEPQYPDDLSQMQDRLDQVVQTMQQHPPPSEPVDSPEMRAARQAFKDFQRDQTLAGIRDKEDRPMRHAEFDREQAMGQRPGPEDEPDILDQQQAQADLETQRRQNRAELQNPENDIELDDGEVDLEESIAYFSPRLGHYVFENATVIMG